MLIAQPIRSRDIFLDDTENAFGEPFDVDEFPTSKNWQMRLKSI